jgi:hypothetical protein
MTDYATIDIDALIEGRTVQAPPVRRFLRRAALLLVLLVLPFVALLEGSTLLYASGRASTWVALLGGALLALLAVTALGAWASRALTGRARVRFVASWVALPLIAVYLGHSLLFLSAVNAKSEDVRAYYTALHPLLRVAVSTLVLLDDGVVVTDMARTPADYGRMGLPTADWSMHYRQADGWVHALDLRTIGRGPVRNWLTGAYFRLLGFRVLRHVGTADHLHVSLLLAP